MPRFLVRKEVCYSAVVEAHSEDEAADIAIALDSWEQDDECYDCEDLDDWDEETPCGDSVGAE